MSTAVCPRRVLAAAGIAGVFLLLGSPGVRPEPLPSPPLPEPDARRLARDVAYLATTIGPRPAGSQAEQRAAEFIATRLATLGYTVRWQPFPLPGGRQSANVIATRGDQPPQLLIGGHYDSRPRAPGAEDNASGIAVILEVARLLAERDLPVQFVAFGAEERVGSGRNGHHFGSRYYVRTATAAHLAGLRGMLCIDCVGSGTRFLVQGCASDDGRLARHCRVLAWRHGLTPGGGPARLNSDHAAFARAGVPVAYYHRLPHPQTHTPHDLPYRVRPEFLQETATAVLLASEDLCAPLAALWPREPAAGGSRSG